MDFHCQPWTLFLIAMSNSPYYLNCSTVWLTPLHNRLNCYRCDTHSWGGNFLLAFSYLLHAGCVQPFGVLCYNGRDGGAWWAAVYGVAQSRTRLK